MIEASMSAADATVPKKRQKLCQPGLITRFTESAG